MALPAFKSAVPSCVCPSTTVIEPVGTPDPDCGVTLAVKVMLCPLVNCVAEAENDKTVVIFGRAETVINIAVDVEEE